MSSFIIVDSVLMEYDSRIEDEELRISLAKEVGMCKVLVNIGQIETMVELVDETRIDIILISGAKVYSTNSFNEVIQKINAAQVVASVQ